MIPPLATIAFVSAAYLGWLGVSLAVQDAGGAARIFRALRRRDGPRRPHG